VGAYERVAAVVVTWNRHDLLKQCLSAMEAQTRPVDLLVVVDNASTDGTGAYLTTRAWTVPHRVITMPTNTGGAGGFARGVDEAAREGFAAWLIDDDGVPDPDALAVLLDDAAAVTAATGHVPAFMCSTIEWSDGSANGGNVPRPAGQWTHAAVATGRPVIEVQTASFVSVLIPAEHARAVGLPHAEYYKWYDDAEYTFRLYRRFGPGMCSIGSRVRHHTAVNGGVLPWQADQASLDAHATGLRNRMSASLSTRDARGLLELVRDCGRVVRTRDLPVRARGRLIGAALQGVAFRPPIHPVGPDGGGGGDGPA
jgi:glycosyltransferase involved in cell wall biosynthesis